MKRKIAFLLALIMTLSLLPINVAYGATINSLDKPSTVVPEKTLFLERGALEDSAQLFTIDGDEYDTGDIDYYLDGTNLVMVVQDYVTEGMQVRLELSNARWFYRAENEGVTLKELARGKHRLSAGGLEEMESNPNHFANFIMNKLDGDNTPVYKGVGDEVEQYPELMRAIGSRLRFNGYKTTFNPETGTTIYDVDSRTLSYVRYPQGSARRFQEGTNRLEVPYSLEFSRFDNRHAVLTILGGAGDNADRRSYRSNVSLKSEGFYEDADPSKQLLDDFSKRPAVQNGDTDFAGYAIVVPLITVTNGGPDVTITLSDSVGGGITTTRHVYAVTGGGNTVTSIVDPQTARDDFTIPELTIRELRINTIKDGVFVIETPRGFTFKGDRGKPINTKKYKIGDVEDQEGLKMAVDLGLQWENNGTGQRGPGIKDMGKSDGVSSWNAWFQSYPGETDINYSRLFVELKGIASSTTITGSLHIFGLEFEAEENAPYGEIMFSIRDSRDNSVEDYSGAGISPQTFKAGERKPWDIDFRTTNDLPNLVNGRYFLYNHVNADDDTHMSAEILFAEQSVNAWWAGRDTIFTLPEGVKFRKVEIMSVDNVEGLEEDEYTDLSGRRANRVTILDNVMTWNNLSVPQDERGSIKFKVWVSIRSGFEGPVTLSISGRAIPENQSGETITIANQRSPITITTRVTDVPIGYQEYETADITITETEAGMLERGRQVLISVTDMTSQDLLFSPSVIDNVRVTNEGDLRFSNISMLGTGEFGISRGGVAIGGVAGTGGTISLTIDRASSVATAITLSNVSMKIDRTVPFTNVRPYQVVVWGSAIAPNFGPNPDQFPSKWAGIMEDYVMVMTAPGDRSSLMHNEVHVTIGQSFVMVNGEPVDMDAAAYISTASNSTMVPLRFVSNALGINDSDITWSDTQRSVTIVIPGEGRTLQFTIGDSIMLDNGVPRQMESPDVPPLPVSPEISGDRSYVPFRALGNAFGIPVSWDESTQTAIYNEGVYAGAR